MGWAGGSRLFNSLIHSLTDLLPGDKNKELRKKFYRDAINAFRDDDWDTLDECVGIDDAYDEVYNEIYPQEEYYSDEI